MKRQHVAIEAMRHVRSGFRLVLAGKADENSYQAKLEDLIRRHRLEDRVTVAGLDLRGGEGPAGWPTPSPSLYLPVDEDSYGYVTLEAFHSAKPVLTFRDSGGIDELVEHGHNGLILEPTPEALAEGLERLWADRAGPARWAGPPTRHSPASRSTGNTYWTPSSHENRLAFPVP